MCVRKLLLLLPWLLVLPLPGEDYAKYGPPACAAPVLDKTYYVVCYDADHKIPAWVGYALSKADLANPAAGRGGIQFREDQAIPAGQRAKNADYGHSGYDKGHMAPAADFERSLTAMKATFVLSNAVPQKHGVNAGLWKTLETAVRHLAETDGAIWVFSGPVFAGDQPMKNIGASHVGVPTHTFKVVLGVPATGQKEMFAFVVPNLDKPQGQIDDYALSVSQVEKLVHLDFFNRLPTAEQKQLEAAVKKLSVQ